MGACHSDDGILSIEAKMNSEQFSKYLEHLDHPIQFPLGPNVHR